MNTITLPGSISHPPDPEDREVLQIPVPADRSELALTDRLSLRIGLWLLLRAQRPRRRPTVRSRRGFARVQRDATSLFDPARALDQREALTVLSYDLHRHLR